MMRLGFVCGEVGVGIRRNFSMFSSVVMVSFISLLFVGTAALSQMQINKLRSDLNDKVQVSVFLCSDADRDVKANCSGGAVTEDQQDAIKKKLEGPGLYKYVQSVSFVSQEDAFERLKKRNTKADITMVTSPEDLPKSFDVSLRPEAAENFRVINDSISGDLGVEMVQDSRAVLEKSFLVYKILSFVAMAIAILMLICAVLLISSTIRQSAFTRRRETSIMRLVGASKTTIQLPFILEGLIATLIGSALAAGALWSIMFFYIDNGLARQEVNAMVSIITSSNMWIVAPFLISIAGVIAVASGLVTLRRYLRV